MRTLTVFSALYAVVGLSASQTIDPTTVPLGIRDAWCRDQKNSCPLLCLQTTESATTTANDCDAKTLNWHCVCNDGKTPNMSEYSLTVPYYLCTEAANQCVAKCGQNNACSDQCRTANPCGAQSPTRVNSTSTASSTGSKSTGTGGFSSFGGSGSDADKSGAGRNMVQIGQQYGLALVAGGVFAGFAIFL